MKPPNKRDKRPPQMRAKTPGVVEKSDALREEVWRKSSKEHKSIATIAEEMGITRTAVADLKHRAWKEVLQSTTESTDVYRAECTEKFAQLIETWWSAAKTDIQAATFVANTVAKMAKINGCEVTKVALSDADGKALLPADLMMLIATGRRPKEAQITESKRLE